MFNSKVFVAELIGTFAFVFVGAYSAIYSGGQDLLIVALGHGLTLAVFVYAFGHISGTHVNPAVTFGLALQGVVDWGKAVVSYWIPQFLGAIGAAFMVKTFVSPLSAEAANGMATIGALNEAYPYHALGLEVILTFFLMNTILHTVVSGKGGMFSGLAIGMTYTIGFLAGGPLTGASMNPVRTFGPAVFTGSWNDPMTYMIYFLGPLFGATIAVLVYQFLTKEDEGLDEYEVEEAEEIEEEPKPAKKPVARKTTSRKSTVPKTTTRKTTKK
ncbi:MAG TPA: aquaporin [Anaerolineales bacterium]|nr:aquaporin [Anaerolineales bacterium]